MILAIALSSAAALYIILIFNRLISLKVRADNAWSDIDVQLKRRIDLVPSLVETVRGYASHESGTLQRAVAARNDAIKAESNLPERARRESELTREVHHLIALAEAYPNLKADDMFLSLQQTLVEVEDHLQSARRYYNAVVRDLNTLLRQFPHAVVAGALGFKPREFFELESEDQAAAPAIDMESKRA